jgi:hemoglobin
MNSQMNARKIVALFVPAVAAAQVVWLAGCAGKAQPVKASQAPQASVVQPAPKPTRPVVAKRGTLYERLGGETVIREVVDDLVSRAGSDPAVNFARRGHGEGWQATPDNLDRLKHGLVAYLTTTAGGPLQYRDHDMVSAHRGMAISNAEFDAFVRNLGAALESRGVATREREELLRAVGTTRAAIVEAPDAPPAPAPTAEVPTPSPAPDAPQPEQATVEAPQSEVVPTEPAPQDTAPVVAPQEEPVTGEAARPEDATADEPAQVPNDTTPQDNTPQEVAPKEPAPETPEADAPAYDDDAPQEPRQ